jgi:hypothetical protein
MTTRLPRQPVAAAAEIATAVALLERYAAADRELADELNDIAGEPFCARRVSQSTVDRLVRLIEDSLRPGVRAKADLDALPPPARRAGVVLWARQVLAASQPAPAGGRR